MNRNPNMSLQKTPMPVLDIANWTTDFEEAELGYTTEQAILEAGRCLDCPGRYCSASCPLHMPIPEFIGKIQEGDFNGAYDLIAAVNPLPEISCRVCPKERQCEKNCTRGIKGEPTAIGWLERFAAEHGRSAKVKEIPPKKAAACSLKVAIAGAGPAGLACGEVLAMKGYAVEVYEADHCAGGVPVSGIPRFILPDRIMAEYLQQITALGVIIHTNSPFGKKLTIGNWQEKGYDALFIASGTGCPILLDIEGKTLPQVYTAKDYLNTAKTVPDSLRRSGHKSVAVIGGGNTAIDVCRSALRLGVENVYLIYRRTREEMPARRDEMANAEAEGVQFQFLSAPTRITGESRVTGLVCTKMKLQAPDYPGGRKNVSPMNDTEFLLEVDAVITALGFSPVPTIGIPADTSGYVLVGRDGVTTPVPGIFAGGDITGTTSSVIAAVAAGKKAAIAIDKYLNTK